MWEASRRIPNKKNKKKTKAEKRKSSLNQRNGPKVYEPRTKTREREKEGERENFWNKKLSGDVERRKNWLHEGES